MTPYDFWNSQFNQTVLRNIQENNLRAAQFRVESELRMQRMHASVHYLHQLPCQGISMSKTGMLRTTYGPIEQNFVDYWSSYRGDGQPTRQEVFRSFFKQAVDMAAHATKEEYPVYSLLFDEIGLITADTFSEAIMKAASMCDTVIKESRN